MTNFEKYHFDDFTLANYRKMLQTAKRRGWVFRRFTDYQPGEPFLLWRHDVDVSLEAAVDLAKIEAEEGVISTYFLLFHSEFYNLLNEPSRKYVEKIMKAGHDIGLHYDLRFCRQYDEQEWRANREAEMIQYWMGTYPLPISFHVHNISDESHFGIYINACSKKLQQDIKYISDSNGIWRYDRLPEYLETCPVVPMQVLTHPCYWTYRPMSPMDRIELAMERQRGSARGYFMSVVKSTGREMIGDE